MLALRWSTPSWQTSAFAKLGGEPGSPHKPDFEVCPGSTGPRGIHTRSIPRPELKAAAPLSWAGSKPQPSASGRSYEREANICGQFYAQPGSPATATFKKVSLPQDTRYARAPPNQP